MKRLLGRWLSSTGAACMANGSSNGSNNGHAASNGTTAAATGGDATDTTSASLRYVLSTFRFHNDVRPPSKVLVLHDYLANASEWQEALHGSLHLDKRSDNNDNSNNTNDNNDNSVSAYERQRRDELLLLLHPLEVYCVDLPGHALSEHVASASLLASHNNSNNSNDDCDDDGSGAAYTRACASDVTRLRHSVLASHETTLCGVGYGAMVACQAALQQPDAYSSVCVVVDTLAQLWCCTPTAYAARAALCAAPTRARTLAELRDYLAHAATATAASSLLSSQPSLSRAMQSVLLAAAEQCRGHDRDAASGDDDGAYVRLRYAAALRQRTQPLRADALLRDVSSPYTGPVHVLVTRARPTQTSSHAVDTTTTTTTRTNVSDEDDDAQALQRLQRHFPHAKVVYADDAAVAAATVQQQHNDNSDEAYERRRAALMRAAVVPRALLHDTAATRGALQPFLASGDEVLVDELLRTLAAWDVRRP